MATVARAAIVAIPVLFCRRCGCVTEQLSIRDLPSLSMHDAHAPSSIAIRVKCHPCQVIYTLDVPVLTATEESCL